ncbi:MAG: Fic family protein [Saprospiraceae bacterium]|nr:Fic family protein [Saprospiraceae bacterium]
MSKLIHEVEGLLSTYQGLKLEQVLDYEKFNHYAITHHSTQIEGSTLTEIETRLLLDEQLTPKGKPLVHSLMVQDHFKALVYTIQQATEKREISVALIQEINGCVLKSTGAIYRTLYGDIDSSQGVFRKSNVSAGTRFFVHFEKVEKLVIQFCASLNEKISKAKTIEEQLLLSFDAHFDLVTIHPFYDGNGRTARLLMNFIQAYFNLPLAIVFKEEKVAYFEALEKTRKKEDLQYFRSFMLNQYKQHLSKEIDTYQAMNTKPNSGGGYSLVF